jgi:hypothetical protein
MVFFFFFFQDIINSVTHSSTQKAYKKRPPNSSDKVIEWCNAALNQDEKYNMTCFLCPDLGWLFFLFFFFVFFIIIIIFNYGIGLFNFKSFLLLSFPCVFLFLL